MWYLERCKESTIYEDLHKYKAELANYEKLLAGFSTNISDLRHHLDDQDDVCKQLELVEGGLEAIFPSGQLSFSQSGYVEPLLPPMRHPEFCWSDLTKRPLKNLMTLGYIVQDFAYMCRKLKKTSRIVLVDMGAALDFHGTGDKPAIYLLSVFAKFGFKFDHIMRKN